MKRLSDGLGNTAMDSYGLRGAAQQKGRTWELSHFTFQEDSGTATNQPLQNSKYPMGYLCSAM